LKITGAPSSPCSGPFPTSGGCDPTIERTAAANAGDYHIEITNPVLDSDSVLMSSDAVGGRIVQAVNSSGDGLPCDRLSVSITYN